MSRRLPMHAVDDQDEDADANRQTASLAGLAAVLFLVVLSLELVRVLGASAAVEDCLLAGRRNCDALVHAPLPQAMVPP